MSQNETFITEEIENIPSCGVSHCSCAPKLEKAPMAGHTDRELAQLFANHDSSCRMRSSQYDLPMCQ